MQTRKTKVKTLVTTIFQHHHQPLSLTQVYQTVKEQCPQTAHSTVYRIIKHLHQQRQLIQVDWRQRGSYYEWAHRHHHHHLVCEKCGQVVDIDDAVIGFQADQISHQTGFVIHNHSIEIKGVCTKCQ